MKSVSCSDNFYIGSCMSQKKSEAWPCNLLLCQASVFFAPLCGLRLRPDCCWLGGSHQSQKPKRQQIFLHAPTLLAKLFSPPCPVLKKKPPQKSQWDGGYLDQLARSRVGFFPWHHFDSGLPDLAFVIKCCTWLVLNRPALAGRFTLAVDFCRKLAAATPSCFLATMSLILLCKAGEDTRTQANRRQERRTCKMRLSPTLLQQNRQTAAVDCAPVS